MLEKFQHEVLIHMTKGYALNYDPLDLGGQCAVWTRRFRFNPGKSDSDQEIMFGNGFAVYEEELE